MIREAVRQSCFRYGWEGAYMAAKEGGYSRSYSGFIYAAKRLGLCGGKKKKPNTRKSGRRYPEILVPGEKVQVDVKEVPYNCLKGAARRDEKHLYRWTAIDECTKIRFIYGFEEHTPENSVKFFKMLQKIFPFKIQTIQADNGTEFTYKYISDTELCPFDIALKNAGVQHKLIPPRTPWHNGEVERSHRNDQHYFYNWEKFASVKDPTESSKIICTGATESPCARWAAKALLISSVKYFLTPDSLLSHSFYLFVGHIYLQRRRYDI